MPPFKIDAEFKQLIEDEIDFNIPNSILDSAIEFIGKNLDPDDVFKTSDLEIWAENNGYKKE